MQATRATRASAAHMSTRSALVPSIWTHLADALLSRLLVQMSWHVCVKTQQEVINQAMRHLQILLASQLHEAFAKECSQEFPSYFQVASWFNPSLRLQSFASTLKATNTPALGTQSLMAWSSASQSCDNFQGPCCRGGGISVSHVCSTFEQPDMVHQRGCQTTLSTSTMILKSLS